MVPCAFRPYWSVAKIFIVFVLNGGETIFITHIEKKNIFEQLIKKILRKAVLFVETGKTKTFLRVADTYLF